MLYQDVEIMGYSHIQFWPESRATMRILVVDENKLSMNAGSTFLVLIERWLKSLHIERIQAESRQSALQFYLKNGYSKMLFSDPENHESDPNDVPVGKIL